MNICIIKVLPAQVAITALEFDLHMLCHKMKNTKKMALWNIKNLNMIEIWDMRGLAWDRKMVCN